MSMMIRNYRELIRISSFEERLKYLSLQGVVGATTFGGHRLLNQTLYRSAEWKRIRREVILRDEGFDLAHPDHPIGSVVYIHHINPITIDDLIEGRPTVFDLDNLVSVSFGTHQAIHYGVENYKKEWKERAPNDTCPWK